MELPNLARLAQKDPSTLTAWQLQVHAIRQDYEAKHPISPSPEKTARMAAAVPALLTHIDELYGEIENLRKYAETTKYHQDNHSKAAGDLEALKGRVAETLNLLDGLDRVRELDDRYSGNIIDQARNLLGGAR